MCIIERPTHSSGHTVLSRIPRKVLVRIRVVLFDLLDDILTDVGVILLDFLGTVRIRVNGCARSLVHASHSRPSLILCWDSGGLSSVSEKLKDKVGDVSTGDGDMFDGGADDVAISLEEGASGCGQRRTAKTYDTPNSRLG